MATPDTLPADPGPLAIPSGHSLPSVPDCGGLGPAPPKPHLRLDAVAADRVSSVERSLLICGKADESLDLLPEGSVQTVVTSPPYWSLRDYGASGQIGRDDALSAYLDTLVRTFRKVRRALREDGTLWLNIGDSYTSGNRRYRAPDRKNASRAMDVRPATPEGLKPKDLIGVPWRVALALQEDGWWLRSEVIWYKPNAHPESVRDRPTKAHETVFLFSKGMHYHYDVAAVKGPNDRRLRSVWEIPTEPQAVPHRYQLLEIPTTIFASLQQLPLSAFQRDPTVLDCCVGDSVAAQVALDRSDAKITVRNIRLDACVVHAEWFCEEPAQ